LLFIEDEATEKDRFEVLLERLKEPTLREIAIMHSQEYSRKR
jgi:hypothetical protein